MEPLRYAGMFDMDTVTKPNGNGSLDALQAQTQAHMSSVSQMTPEQLLSGYVESVVSVTINGLIFATPAVPADLMFKTITAGVAKIIGGMFMAADDVVVMKFRKEIRDMFRDTLMNAPINRPQQQKPQMTATIPEDVKIR
jgi:hypothetical protein